MKDALRAFLDRVEDAIGDLRVEMDDGDVGREVDHDAAGPARRPGVTSDTLVQVRADELFLLVNRARKMIRLAREGKVPNMEQRKPLRDIIRAIKARGLIQKPVDLNLDRL